MEKGLVNGVFWTFFFQIASVLLQFGTTAVLARLILPDIFGEMSLLLIVVGLSRIVSQFGLGAALIQTKHFDLTTARAVFGLILLIAGLLAVITIFSAEVFSNFFQNNHLTLPLRAVSVIFLLDAITFLQTTIARRRLEYRFIARASFLSILFGNSLVAIILSCLNFQIWALVSGAISSSAILALIYIKRFGFYKPIFSLTLARSTFQFGGFYTLGILTNFISNNIDNLLIGRFLGTESLGFYTKSYQLASAPVNLLGTTLQQVFFPYFAQFQDERDKIKQIFLFSSLTTNYASCLVIGVILCIADWLIFTLLGANWYPTVEPFKVLVCGIAFRLSARLGTPVLNALGLVKITAALQFVYMISIFGGVFIGAQRGLFAVAIAVTCAIGINYLITLISCAYVLRVSINEIVHYFLKPIILSSPLLVMSSVDIPIFLAAAAAICFVILSGRKINLFQTEKELFNMLKRELSSKLNL